MQVPSAGMVLEFARRLTVRVMRGDQAVWDHLRQPGEAVQIADAETKGPSGGSPELSKAPSFLSVLGQNIALDAMLAYMASIPT